MYVKLIKVFYIPTFSFVYYIEPGHTEEMLWKTLILLFIDSWCLLYTQTIISEENTADMEIRVTLDVIMKNQDCQMGCC